MNRTICAYCGGVGATTTINHYQTFYKGRVALTSNIPLFTTTYHPECRALQLQGK